MTVLTVGTGEEFATLASAIAASHDGDVIDVSAGTYTNDFATISTNITIEGIGGMVQLVATVAPPNGKAILTTDANVTLVHIAFSGAAVADNNGAGIRGETGNLTLVGDSFDHNQEGILAAANPTGRIDIFSSEFGYNGAGDGYSHNLYVNEVGTLTISDSYFHDAVGGNEIKSRAETTIITDTRIIDGSAQTGGGYDVDLPDGGTATLTGDTIEKGLNEPNGTMVHFGVEATPYPNSVLTLRGNLLINDDSNASGARVVNNDQSAGAGALATVQDDTIYNVPSADILSGPGTVSGNTLLTGSPSLDTAAPVSALAVIDLTLPVSATSASAGVAINPFASTSFAVINDSNVSATLSGWQSGVLAYDGADSDISVASSADTLIVTGAATAIVAGLTTGHFSYTANAGSPGDTILMTLPGPNLFLALTAGNAATAAASFRESISTVACYRAGTRIATPDGERNVEALAAGDHVLNAAGIAREIRWMGRRSYKAAFVARHRQLQPVRFRSGSLAHGIPSRDLYVSPRHLMFLDGVLVPADRLIHGDTVSHCAEPADVTYVHLELDTHDILLAEGAPSESFCDCDNRWMFQTISGADAQGDDRARWAFCAPVIDDGPHLAAIRNALARHQGVSPPAELFGLSLLVDGLLIAPDNVDGLDFVFNLAAAPVSLRLLSPSVVPAGRGPGTDRRRLGVALHGIVLAAAGRTVVIGPDCAALVDGFHEAEAGHRWTDGDAGLPLSLLAGMAGRLTLTITATMAPAQSLMHAAQPYGAGKALNS